jgi:hypothetical protein
MDAYFLPRHGYFCLWGDDFLVYLNLKTDEYLLLQGDEARALRSLLSEPALSAADDPVSDSGNASDAGLTAELDKLVLEGVLTTDPLLGKEVRATWVALPESTLMESACDDKVHIRPTDVARFVISCVTAALKLRLQRIETIVMGVKTRKALSPCRSFDFQQARRMVAVFDKLRSFFPRNYLCLFDSLALIEFLARYKIFPTWVFAIQFGPWGAHCWVQEETTAFNEAVEEATAYIPIMAI